MKERETNGEGIDEIQARHKALDKALRKITRKSNPLPSEQEEIARLKKLKLRVKDELSERLRATG